MTSYLRYRIHRTGERNNLRLLHRKYDQKLKKDKAFVQKAVCEKKEGLTSLIKACLRGYMKVVRYLVTVCGADVNQVADRSASYKDMQGASPLLSAVVAGHLGMVTFLIRAGADVNPSGHPIWTPMRAATHYGHFDIVKVLLDSGADVELATWHGYPHPSPKWTHRHDYIMDFLAWEERNSHNHFKFALNVYQFTIAKELSYSHYTRISSTLVTHLDYCLIEGVSDMVIKQMGYVFQILIAEAQKQNGNLEVSIIMNLFRQLWQVLDKLSNDNQEAFRKQFYQLLDLEQQYYLGLSTILLHAVCDRLFEAFLPHPGPQQTTDMAAFLLELGADVNARDQYANTPLHVAAKQRPINAQLVDLLINNDAHIDMVNSSNLTPMDLQPTDDTSASALRQPVRHQTLLCLAARAVCKHNVPYVEKDLPQDCIEAIEDHKCYSGYKFWPWSCGSSQV